MLQGCYKGVTKVLQGCYKGVTRVLQGCYKVVTGPLFGVTESALASQCVVLDTTTTRVAEADRSGIRSWTSKK